MQPMDEQMAYAASSTMPDPAYTLRFTKLFYQYIDGLITYDEYIVKFEAMRKRKTVNA